MGSDNDGVTTRVGVIDEVTLPSSDNDALAEPDNDSDALLLDD